MTHWNSKNLYHPVNTWVIIDTPQGEIRAKRPEHYVSHDEDMIYFDQQGREYRGRFRWKYT